MRGTRLGATGLVFALVGSMALHQARAATSDDAAEAERREIGPMAFALAAQGPCNYRLKQGVKDWLPEAEAAGVSVELPLFLIALSSHVRASADDLTHMPAGVREQICALWVEELRKADQLAE